MNSWLNEPSEREKYEKGMNESSMNLHELTFELSVGEMNGCFVGNQSAVTFGR